MKLPFDQAAKYYDQTRADPEWVMKAMADTFLRVTNADGSSKILEVGIGTGRIALNLLERDLNILGVDLSLEMMRELHLKFDGPHAPLRLAQMDGEQIALADETFDVVYAVHVYHLIPNWRKAIDEAYRVLKPGGKLLISYHYRNSNSPNRKIRAKFGELAQTHGYSTKRPGARDTELRAELSKWNGRVESIRVAEWKFFESPAQILDEVEARHYSDVWLVPPEVQIELMPKLREWARNAFGNTLKPIETAGEFVWLVARKS
jgi:ubiquinone/menaquinone biosynthesis C-methylase UbiE